MSEKLRLAVLFGGLSGEHEVSLDSADSVIRALDKKKYEIIPVGISKKGEWFTAPYEAKEFSCKEFFKSRKLAKVFMGDPSLKGMLILDEKEIRTLRLDAVFPVLHGTFGEDGTVQGLLELSGLPYAGCGVLGSSAGMDKEYMKKLFRHHRIPTPEFCVVRNSEIALDEAIKKTKELGFPVFVKPANMGSSVGISKVSSLEGLESALDCAFRYDNKILIEKGIDAREIECSVLGGTEPVTSCLGEIIPKASFYDYSAKYIDSTSELVIPAKVDDKTEQHIRKLAERAFCAIDGYGFARVDFLVDRKTSAVFVNEINTIPGFTSISMFPKLWEKSGIPYSELLDIIIDLAIEREEQKGSLSRDFHSKSI